MGSVIDTLEVLFTADIAPLTARLSEIGRGLAGLSAASGIADQSLRALAGSLDFGMGTLQSRAYASGAAVGSSFARGLRSRKGAVDSAVRDLTASALSALSRLSAAGAGAGGSGAQSTAALSAARFDANTLAGGAESGAQSPAVTNLTIPINVDGISLGEACIRGIHQVSRITGRAVIGV